VSQVSEYRDLTVERYRADWKTQRIVERTLQMMIEACLDVASHVIADRGVRAPSTYAETFESLVETGLMSSDLGHVMVEMSRFRERHRPRVRADRRRHGDPDSPGASRGLRPVRDRSVTLVVAAPLHLGILDRRVRFLSRTRRI
jgi:hypothetical protein